MPEPGTKPPMVVELVWEHDLVLAGRSAHAHMTLDSEGVAGPSPMQALAFALAGCMAMDVVHILQKGRLPLRGLRADLKGYRPDDPPRRYVKVELHFTITGAIPTEPVERAIQLSRDKYCSVWHSMREDIALETSYTISEGV
jgi:putative redox protein